METHRIVHTWGIKRAYQPREGRREQTFLGRKERRTNKDVSENSVRDEQRVQVRIRREIKLKFGEKKLIRSLYMHVYVYNFQHRRHIYQFENGENDENYWYY